MKEILISLYEKYNESIYNFLQTFSYNEWILIGFTFIGFIIRIPLLVLTALSASSYLALQNETAYKFLEENLGGVSPLLAVISLWCIIIFLMLFIVKSNKEGGYSNFIRNSLSFALIFVLTISIGTPQFMNSAFKEYKTVIMVCILLYALFHIFRNSISLIKNVCITFAWIFIITLLGFQYNKNILKNILENNDIKSFKEVQYSLKDSFEKNKENVKVYTRDFVINNVLK